MYWGERKCYEIEDGMYWGYLEDVVGWMESVVRWDVLGWVEDVVGGWKMYWGERKCYEIEDGIFGRCCGVNGRWKVLWDVLGWMEESVVGCILGWVESERCIGVSGKWKMLWDEGDLTNYKSNATRSDCNWDFCDCYGSIISEFIISIDILFCLFHRGKLIRRDCVVRTKDQKWYYSKWIFCWVVSERFFYVCCSFG
jgi:hypothetical protein